MDGLKVGNQGLFSGKQQNIASGDNGTGGRVSLFNFLQGMPASHSNHKNTAHDESNQERPDISNLIFEQKNSN